MALNRRQLHLLAAQAQFDAGRFKRPTRAQVKRWFQPIRDALAEMATGYANAQRGYVVTRLHTGDDYVRTDFCINGFVGVMERLLPDLDVEPLRVVSKRLANGVLLTKADIDTCFRVIKQAETALIKFKWDALIDAATAEQCVIELERLGMAA